MLIAGKQQALPVVVLDSDRSGKDYASKLEKELYFNDTDKILMFRLGDFYEMFFEDAKIASKELGLTLTKSIS